MIKLIDLLNEAPIGTYTTIGDFEKGASYKDPRDRASVSHPVTVQKVKVCRLRDRVNSDVAGKLGKVGVIKNFKMTDGSGVGAVVQFDDKTATWFFEDELKLI